MVTTIKRFNLKAFQQKLPMYLRRAGNMIYRELKPLCKVYSHSIVYKQKIVSSVNGVQVGVGLGGSAFYVAFVEWGTGLYMPDWWIPYKEKGGAIADVPRIPREGKYITRRGEGNSWTDWGGHHHKGSNRFIHSEGQKGQHRLRKAMRDYVVSGALSPTLSLAISEAVRGSLR